MRWLRPKATSARSGYGSPVRICRGRSMAWAWSTSSAQTGKRPAPTRGGRSSQLRGSSNSCCRVTKPAPAISSQLNGAGWLPPATSKLPVRPMSANTAREFCTPLAWWTTGAALNMSAAGLVVAYSLAAARIFSAGTPVMPSTRSGSNCRT